MGYTKHKRQIKRETRTTRKQRIKNLAPLDNTDKSNQQSTESKQRTESKPSTGGNVINSGGYGCIFKPALKCKGKPRDKRKISKLMLTRHSEEEYKFIMKYKKNWNIFQTTQTTFY